MADIKNLLKEARKLIDEKNYQEAQECCKNILRKDKQNYLALVLLGKSFQDTDQAPLAYQKAITIKPDNPLAWQGLASYYERKIDTDAKEKLFDIYSEILKLKIEEDKVLEIINKLGEIGSSARSGKALGILCKYLTEEHSPKISEMAKTQFIKLLEADIQCFQDDVPSILDVLQKILVSGPSDSLEVLYGKIILQNSNFQSAIEKIINLKCFSTNVLLREWLCRTLCINYVQNNSFSGFPVDEHIDKITTGIEHSKYPGLLKSIISYDKGDYVDAYKQCVPLVNYQEADITEATFIIRCTFKLKKWSVAEKLATNFLNKVKDSKFTVELNKLIFLALAKQQKWKQAISVAKDIPLENLDNFEKATLAECCIEDAEPIDSLMSTLEDTEYYIQLNALLLLKQKKYTETVNLLESHEESSLTLFYLGKAYWYLKKYEQCLVALLKAAKIDSEHASTFLYLGHFYHYYKEDLDKSKRCYEKAYSLNNTNTEIAKNLSEVYTKLTLKDADFELLNDVQKNIPTTDSWVNFRLGFHYLNRKDWDNAITNFRIIVKRDPNDIIAFECLADGYYFRGSFTSALRAYEKVMKLNPNRIAYCLTRTGYIYILLTQYTDAVDTFDKVLTIDPNSLLALKGMAETWMKIAKKKEAMKLYGSAQNSAQNALTYISKALTIQNHFSCFWKLFADTLMFVTKLPNMYAYVIMQDIFDDPNKQAVKKEKLDIFPQAIACYSFIAKQKQQLASYELASAYLDFYLASNKDSTANIAFNMALNCIKENPSSWRNWNLLGKICLFVNKYDVAQHCFIKGLLVTRKWSCAKIWCNLGTLYLKLKLYKIANYCFWRGQSTLPSYPLSWIGQAMIAESIREEEAMDLFRHSSRLGYHPESAMGYADWVCKTLKKITHIDDPEYKYVIEGLNAISYAMDLVEWYSVFEPSNAYACTILGILQERSELHSSALKSYEKALEYVQEDKKNISLLNVARIYLQVGRYDEAIKSYKAITEASLNSACGLALALYKKGLYEESYAAYDTALHWLSNDDNEKADLLVAMAGIMYMFKGADDAKTILFHSIQVSQKKPTAYSLFSICSLGLIHSDQSLSKLALSELQKYEKDTYFAYDIGFLKSYLLVKEDEMEEAIKILTDSIHDHPSNAELWFCMAQYCLRSEYVRARIASLCAQRAMSGVHQKTLECDSAQIIAIASVADHLAGYPHRALQLAKKGLFVYPWKAEMWASLLFCLRDNKNWADKKQWLTKAAGYMRRHLDVSRPLTKWIGILEKQLVI